MKAVLSVVRRIIEPGIDLTCRNSSQWQCSGISVLYMQSQRKMSSGKFKPADRLHGTEKNVWVDITRLAVENKALNLGQGFPDFMAPQVVVDALKDVLNRNDKSTHQYAPSFGLTRLTQAISKLYEPHLNRTLVSPKEILVSVGAYGSLFCIFQGLVNPGDEVIIIEPFFDCYPMMTKVAGGTPVFIPLRPTKSGPVTSSADWKLDPDELASKFTDKTKLIVVNTPNNPCGKVFTTEELMMIGDLCKKHDVVCIADEVYEWMTYDNNKHVKMASLPDMWERTITVGSAGKTFSATGWKTGWAVGPHHLIQCAQYVHQNCTFNIPTPIQEALALALENEIARRDSPDCYLTALARELKPKRDQVCQMLQEAGMKPVVPEGGYFVMADFSSIAPDLSAMTEDEPKDFKFVKWLTINKKLTLIPPTAFYSEGHAAMGENYVRVCFIKEDETLEKAGKILKEWRH